MLDLPRFSRFLLPISILVLVAGPARSQHGLFFDTIDVEVVTVEVVVTDREGRPLTGLQREDFELLVDGEPVEITHFLPVEQGVARPPGDRAEDTLETKTGPGAGALEPETRGADVVLLVDNLNLRPQSRNRILGELRDRLEEEGLEPGQRMMIASLDSSLRVRLPFTGDAAALAATLGEMMEETPAGTQLEAHLLLFYRQLENSLLRDFASGGGERDFAFETVVMDAQRLSHEVRILAERQVQQARRTTEELRSFVATLGGIPGRKALVWVSDGLSERPADPLIEAFTGRFEDWMQRNRAQIPLQADQELVSLMTSLGSAAFDAGRHVDDLAREASARGVVFYPYADLGAESFAHVSAESRGSHSGAGPGSLQVKALETSLRESPLLQVAQATGGTALTRGGDLGRLLRQVSRDLESFYSLGFDRTFEDLETHRIEVRVHGRDVTVRHRELLRGNDPLEQLERATLTALHYGVERNPLGARLQPGRTEAAGRGKRRVEVLVQIPFRSLLLVPRGKAHVGEVVLYVVVGDGQGRVSPVQRIDVPIEVPNERLLEVLQGAAAYPLQLEVREGREQTLAVGIRDRLARIDATLTAGLGVGEGEAR